jgi:hypothetical protein
MFAAVQRASQTWQRVAITDFERKQLITLREELNAHTWSPLFVKLSIDKR